MSTVVRRGPYMPGVLCAPFRPCMVLCSFFSARTGTPIIQALAGCFCNYVGQRRVLCTSRVHLWPSLQRIAHDIYPVNLHDLDSVGANWPSSLLLLVQFVHFHYYVKSRALRMFGVINGLRDWLMNPIQNQTTCAKMLSPNVYQVTLFNVETSRIKKATVLHVRFLYITLVMANGCIMMFHGLFIVHILLWR